MRKRKQRIWSCAREAALAAALLTAGEAMASEGGLELVPDGVTLLVLIVVFGVLIVPVNALIFRPIFRVLDARAEKIAGTRQRAEKVAREAEGVLARYEQAIREVREEAEADRKRQLGAARAENVSQTDAARAEAEREIAGARREVVAALAEARASMRVEAEDLARQVAARVLGRLLS